MFIIIAKSAIHFGNCILGVGHTKSDAILDAYGRPQRLERGHFLQQIDPSDEEWSDCERLQQYR